MSWTIRFHRLFEAEFDELGSEVQDELLTQLRWLQEFGPILGRPRVDTLKGSTHANMKELRFDAEGGVWRVVFAFDPKREAIEAGRRRQVGRQRVALLQTIDRESRRALR